MSMRRIQSSKANCMLELHFPFLHRFNTSLLSDFSFVMRDWRLARSVASDGISSSSSFNACLGILVSIVILW